MKNVLILLDGSVAKGLLKRLILQDTSHSVYDIVYTNDNLIPSNYPKNFTFYKFDPSSYTKLEFVMRKLIYNNILVVLSNKADTLAVVDNIVKISPHMRFTVHNAWDIKFENKHIHNFDAIGILSNGLLENLPNVPVIAQNVGLKQGEIMQVEIPFGSSYAYRYIGSIAQKQWKIFALYRNNKLINVKPTLILKPNDIILIIGKPNVLLQVYASISKSFGHFPMPFGKNVYAYLDLYIQSEDDVLNNVDKAIYLNEKLNNKLLIIKIVRPTRIALIDKIKDKVTHIKNATIEFEYSKDNLNDILNIDKKRFDIGILVLSPTQLHEQYICIQAIETKIAIFKAGSESTKEISKLKVVLNNPSQYEQISPIIFDIASQFNQKITLLNSDPIGDNNRTKLLDHFKNLSEIFNQNINIISNNKNPIKQLREAKNILQVLPLKHDMFSKRYFDLLCTDSDLISYDFTRINQILIPIIEDENLNQENK